jgi:Putative Flp pilus-assembly TadE/G-like
LLLVVVCLAAFIGLAALAIDVTTLYLARSQAEKAADAAALAGAKVFVSTGYTSGGLGSPDSAAAQSQVCNGSSGLADLQATAEANQNKIGGAAPSTVTTACNLGAGENPQITVKVVRKELPTFFGRIFQRGVGQVSATATAEAYNPSGQDVPVKVASVKPWLIANCDYGAASGRRRSGNINPNCAGGPAGYFLDPNNNYAVANRGRFIGETLKLQQLTLGLLPVSLANSYYTLNMPVGALSCPAASAVSCSAVNPASPGYFESVACANSIPLTCGSSKDQGVSVYPLGGVLLSPPHAAKATMCMTHASDFGDDQGQDSFEVSGRSSPITIDGGSNNPNPALRGTPNISRSDSVVTVPIWDGNGICGASGLCGSFNIVGFMLLGAPEIDATILNVAGCGDSGGTGTTAVAGGAVAPIPVRLIQ